jgi:NAD dependent epimerase/dehydratase
MQLSNKKVLVTGAGGFIGSHLVETLLRRGCDVRALVHYSSRPDYGNLDEIAVLNGARLERIKGDIRDSSFVGGLVDGCEVVFHLAALIGIPYSYVAAESYVATNVLGTLNLLNASRAHGIERFVHTSTSECYGSATYVPIDEAHRLRAQSPYAASKIAADKLVESYHCSFGLPASVLRPFNNYGPRQSARAIIPTIIEQLLFGRDELRLGAISPKRDFLFVEDTCEAFCMMAEADSAIGELVHVGTGVSISIGELAETLMQLTGIHKPIVCDEDRLRPEGSEVSELRCDPTRARELIAWTPQVSLEEGARRVIDSLQRRGSHEHSGGSYAI